MKKWQTKKLHKHYILGGYEVEFVQKSKKVKFDQNFLPFKKWSSSKFEVELRNF